MKVLVVEDEEAISEMVAAALESEGLEVVCAADGRSALLAVADADVVVLDWMLPDLDGLSVLTAVRSGGNQVPVIMVTARDALDDKVTALSLADDYLTKPFELAELVARVQGMLRRRPQASSGEVLAAGALSLDTALREARVGDEIVPLTPTEYRLVDLLVRRRNSVVTRESALAEVWGFDFGGNRANLDTAISSLRRKLVAAGWDGIETVRGFGYLVRDP